MLSRSSCARLCVTLVLLAALPWQAQAQSQSQESRLKLPTSALAAAAAADWTTTYYALKHYRLREANPLLRPLDHKPARLVTLGTAMDVGMVAAWNYSVGRDHPKVAAAGLWAMTAFRAYLAIHNIRNVQRTARR